MREWPDPSEKRGNQYMRAKKEFEKQWLAEHASDQTTTATVTLDNGSIGGLRK
jgi:hypothetical protein